MAESCQFDDEFESEDIDVDREEDLSRYYVFRGFDYKIIILLLLKNHDVEISLSTLKRRIKSYGVRRQRLQHRLGYGFYPNHNQRAWIFKRVQVVVLELLRETDPGGFIITQVQVTHGIVTDVVFGCCTQLCSLSP